MPLELLRQLAFDGEITGFVRDPPGLLLPPHPVTGLHLQFDTSFLRRVTEYIFERGLRFQQDQQPHTFGEIVPSKRDERRNACEAAIRDQAITELFDWRARCDEAGYPKGAKPVVIIVDVGEKAESGWLRELPRTYNSYPIRYRFSPEAEAQFTAGSRIGKGGPNWGTLGGILQDSVTLQLFGVT